MASSLQEKDKSTLNILIVQGRNKLREQIEEELRCNDYSCITAVHDARNALKVLRTQPIELLICDSELKQLDGWRLSRLVRSGALRCHAAIPIIMTTETWCERIAEVTAREHAINALFSVDEVYAVAGVLEACLEEDFVVSKPRLLIVEDDPDTQDLIGRILAPRFEIEMADSGENGIEAWLERRHDLVLLDVMLPVMQGPEVLDGILQVQPNQPVVIMTAHAPIEEAEELLIRGAADFIPKPFRAEQLRTVSEVALRRDDYMVSNRQFAERVRSLAEREAAYRKVSERHRQLLDNLQTTVIELDDKLNTMFLNQAWNRVFGYDVEESLSRPFKDFLSSSDLTKYRAIESRFKSVLLGEKEHCDMELSLNDAAGDKRWVELQVSRSHADPKRSTLTICLDDITKRKQAQTQLEYQVNHDLLTGLYNRNYFDKKIEDLTDGVINEEHTHGLICLDLDYFKVINDRYGHHFGDDLLKAVSSIIKKQIRDTDILCRFGGDEFAAILQRVDLDTLEKVSSNIKNKISEFYTTIDRHPVSLTCSVGVVLIDGSSDNAEEYLMFADRALNVAKQRGRNIVRIYNPEDSETENLRSNVELARQAREAIKQDRLVMHFQPVVNISTGEVYYYEALVRMLGEDGRLIMPGAFINAMEQTGHIGLLDRWVIKCATKTLSEYPRLKKIAINLSAQTFRDEELVPIIRECLKNSGVEGEKITFELTESASLMDLSATKRVVSELHKLGCSVALDDFGTGFSSFSYLKSLPADYIKLDGSFIRNLHEDKVDQALVRSIIQVVKTLGRKTVAEFVENEEILQFLAANGVDYAQGYHISRPIPIDQVPLESKVIKGR